MVPERPDRVPPTVNVVAEQTTATLPMFTPLIVPWPIATVQVCPAGWVSTVTSYAPPLDRVPGRVKGPLAETLSPAPPFTRSTTVPASPDTLPPTVNAVVRQATVTFAMFAPASVPEPFPMEQLCPAGCVSTVTAYAAPPGSVPGRVKGPFAETLRFPPPLS